jgi:hypothetical protein
MSQPWPWACNQGKGLQERGPRERLESVGECENVHSHSQVNSHFGNWSPSGLLNFQRAIARVKTHRPEELFTSLESY